MEVGVPWSERTHLRGNEADLLGLLQISADDVAEIVEGFIQVAEPEEHDEL